MTAQPTILVFDSGLGGLTVFREVVKARPDARFVYAADDAFFPYGRHDEPVLIARVVEVMGELIAAHRPDLVVVACNTASVQALAELRKNFQVPFVGTVPAIKPACSSSQQQARHRARHRGHRETRVHPRAHPRARQQLRRDAGRLAAVRRARRGRPERRSRVRPRHRRRDFALLRRGRRQAHRHHRAGLHALSACCCLGSKGWRPGRCNFIDPAPAIARRVLDLLGPPAPGAEPSPARAVFTSGRPPAPALAALWRASASPKAPDPVFDTPGNCP